MREKIYKLLLYLNPFLSIFLFFIYNTTNFCIPESVLYNEMVTIMPPEPSFCEKIIWILRGFYLDIFLPIILSAVIQIILLVKLKDKLTKRQKIKFILYFFIVVLLFLFLLWFIKQSIPIKFDNF